MKSYTFGRRFIITFSLTVLMFLSVSSAAQAGFLYGTSKLWLQLTNPATSIVTGGGFVTTVPPDGVGMLAVTHYNMDSDIDFGSLYYDNFLIKLLTFGNKDSHRELMYAESLGENILPYGIFAYRANGDWYYHAKHSNAPAVLLYGYSWLVNIPAKLLRQLDAVLMVANIEDFTGISKVATWTLLIDLIPNILSLLVEIPLAIVNTIIGFFVAFLFNPWDSFCAIPGMIYFLIGTTVNAVLDVLGNCALIIWHTLKLIF